MDSITDKRIERMGGQLPYRERHPSRSRARKRQRGSGKMSRPRGGVKREKAGIGYPCPNQ